MANANALGMVETRGLVGAIEAADAMVEAAQRKRTKDTDNFFCHGRR